MILSDTDMDRIEARLERAVERSSRERPRVILTKREIRDLRLLIRNSLSMWHDLQIERAMRSDGCVSDRAN
jgi:hypothetical protein